MRAAIHIRKLSCLVSLAIIVSCGSYVPPAPPTPRPSTRVAASFDKTWAAVVDLFSERNIQIKTIDKASGVIAAEPQSAPNLVSDSLADCGHSTTGRGYSPSNGPASAVWNVLVRGDSASSTVRATVRFSFLSRLNGQTYECSSTGRWETAFEQSVKTNAEGKGAGG